MSACRAGMIVAVHLDGVTGDPNSRRWTKGAGVVEFGVSRRPSRIWTRYGSTKPNPWLDCPLPNVTYFVGPSSFQRDVGVSFIHIYRTDNNGFTACVEAQRVHAFKSDKAGKRFRTSAPEDFPGGKYDRGHLVASQLGAGMEAINLVSMPAPVNRRQHISTAEVAGFDTVAELLRRYRNDDHLTGATLTQSGEFATASYRDFERAAIRFFNSASVPPDVNFTMRIEPGTFRSEGRVVTTIIYVQLFLDTHRLAAWKIDLGLNHET